MTRRSSRSRPPARPARVQAKNGHTPTVWIYFRVAGEGRNNATRCDYNYRHTASIAAHLIHTAVYTVSAYGIGGGSVSTYAIEEAARAARAGGYRAAAGPRPGFRHIIDMAGLCMIGLALAASAAPAAAVPPAPSALAVHAVHLQAPQLLRVGPGQNYKALTAALAAAAARTSSPPDPLTIVLHQGGGVVAGSSLPLVLGPEHSHITIVGSAGSTISGGVAVNGSSWSKFAGGSSNIWVAKTLAGLPSARQLYVDGIRANRTQLFWPRGKFEIEGSSLTSSDSSAAASLLQLTDGSSTPPPASSRMEAVFTGGGKERAPHAAPGQSSYREARCPVVSIARTEAAGAAGVNLTIAEPCYSRARRLSHCSTPSYISNSRQLLLLGGASAPSPGSFFFDSAKAELLYAAPPGWQPAESEVVLPVNQTLLQVKAGTQAVTFEGVVFEHGGWLAPNEDFGFVDDQAGTECVEPQPGTARTVLPNKTIPANVVVEGGAHGVLFDGCTFRHLGGTALHFQAGAQHSSVERTEFYDVSASAVMIGNVTDWDEHDLSKQTLNITVADCVVSNLPREYHGAVAISVFIAAQASILHNDISGCSYSAVSVGWGWASAVGNSSYARENKVIGNYFHDTMQLLFDGGDLYTLGSQPGSEAAFNHIHGHKGCEKTNGLYHDQGTAHWTDHHNVVQLGVGPHPCRGGGRDAAAWAIMWIDSIHDCHLFSNFADTNVSVNWDHSGVDCSINTTTIFDDSAVPAAAQKIIYAAGPRSTDRVL